VNFVHKFHNLVFVSFSQKFSRSLDFVLPPLRNESMQCALPTPFIFFLFFFGGGVTIPDCQFPKFTENTHKYAQNCAYNVQKLFAAIAGVAEKGEDMRMGG